MYTYMSHDRVWVDLFRSFGSPDVLPDEEEVLIRPVDDVAFDNDEL